MSLSQSIVITSSFGQRADNRTPGNYIERYTSRVDATETLTPYSNQQDAAYYLRDYLRRQEAADLVIDAMGSRDDLFSEDERVASNATRIFGNRGLIYTREDFDAAIDATERANAQDHTFITPVVSFTHEYLEENGLLLPDTPEPGEGETYKGLVDQLKLRRAITSGMEAMLPRMHFVEPEWTAAIQVDTQHTHAHLTLIETAPHSRVPEARYVMSPRTYYDDNGHEHTVRDDNGAIVYDNLGERGKINKSAQRAFRRGVDRELLMLSKSQPLVNQLSPHFQLVHDKAVELGLSNDKTASTLTQLYHHLPKGDKEAWVYPSTDPSMKKGQALMEDYVHGLLNDHSVSTGKETFTASLDDYVELAFPDSPGFDQEEKRAQVKETSEDYLVEVIANDIYDGLRLLALYEDEEELDEEHDVLGVRLTNQGRLRLMTDDELKDEIADSLGADSPASKALTLEYRGRSYGERLKDASVNAAYYRRLDEQYDVLYKEGKADPDSLPMSDLYQANRVYYEGVRDKYLYLTQSHQSPFVKVDGRVYTKPQNDGVGERQWGAWLDVNEDALFNRAEAFVEGGQDFKQPTHRIVSFTRDLPYDVQERLLVEGNARGGEDMQYDTFEEGVLYNPTLRRTVSVMSVVDDATKEQEQFSEKITKERFDEVKGYDLMQTLYDFDHSQLRQVSSLVVKSYEEQLHRRADAGERALAYLEDTNQAGDNAVYHLYKEDHERVEESLTFVDDLKYDGNVYELPRPVRRFQKERFERDEDELVLPLSTSYDYSRALLPEVREIVISQAQLIDQASEDLERAERSLFIDVSDGLDRLADDVLDEVDRLSKVQRGRGEDELHVRSLPRSVGEGLTTTDIEVIEAEILTDAMMEGRQVEMNFRQNSRSEVAYALDY